MRSWIHFSFRACISRVHDKLIWWILDTVHNASKPKFAADNGQHSGIRFVEDVRTMVVLRRRKNSWQFVEEIWHGALNGYLMNIALIGRASTLTYPSWSEQNGNLSKSHSFTTFTESASLWCLQDSREQRPIAIAQKPASLSVVLMSSEWPKKSKKYATIYLTLTGNCDFWSASGYASTNDWR